MVNARAGPLLHTVRLQLLGLILNKSRGVRCRIASSDGLLNCARVAVSHKASSRRGGVGVLVVGSCGVLGVGLARRGVVYVGRCDRLHRGWDDHARLNNSLRVNIVRGEPVESNRQKVSQVSTPKKPLSALKTETARPANTIQVLGVPA